MNKNEFCDPGEGKCPLQHSRSPKILETRESWVCSRAGWCDEGAAGGKEEAGPGREVLNKALDFIGRPSEGLKQEGVRI